MRRQAPPKTVIEALRQVPLFARCTKKELRAIAGLGVPVTIGDAEELTRQGSRGREFFVVISGQARCCVAGEDMATFGPGDFFGEMSLLDGQPRTADVTTRTELKALVFDRREFLRLLETSPALTFKMLTSMAGRLRHMDALQSVMDSSRRPVSA